MQARTGTLVSGSSALQFFDRTLYPESDLDLYVHARHRREVGRWLVEEGYAFAPTEHQDPRFEVEVVHGMTTREDGIYSMPGVAAILTFTKPAPRLGAQRVVAEESEEELEVQLEEREPRPLKVQIIVAKNTPMEAILAFHSTCVMNVISYEKAYCLFPRATLEKRLSLLSSSCRGRSKRRSAGLEKYARRGFRMLATLPPDELEPDPASALTAAASAPFPDALAYAPFLYGRPTALAIVGRRSPAPAAGAAQHKPWPAFRVGWRWIDDSASWVLPLSLTGIALPPAANTTTPVLTHDPVAVCNWEVRYPVPARRHGRARHDPGAVMHFEVATGKVLRYRYLVTDADLLTFLGRELSARARAEDLKEDAELEDRTYYDWELRDLCREFLHGFASRRMGSLRA
ncbi:uncharacterized protein TRAVEDRAFT_27113 [Trametes versicolor FP-101664 SS1]|uniref:uncharacterized protein n=1 Tax=Trametes versicolor (strain FP-101664) TaxID=717944 RepID=UPI00046239D6|nr:uncharacterized protein TRAVEDRAFT_27113 [Trametes versicolor FP-101664 SS1]EIW61531.1 hypothetical protein TRAVEDRAFT_27113 [Trametes versicolor FP-101664 SS1]